MQEKRYKRRMYFCAVMCWTNIGSIDNLIPRGIILQKMLPNINISVQRVVIFRALYTIHPFNAYNLCINYQVFIFLSFFILEYTHY